MRSDRLLLMDILDAVETIWQYLPADLGEFESDPPLQSHIYRHLTIIGEAASRLSKPLKERYSQVPWRQIEGMRHVLVHDYFKIDQRQVYATAVDDVPRLEGYIRSILKSIPSD